MYYITGKSLNTVREFSSNSQCSPVAPDNRVLSVVCLERKAEECTVTLEEDCNKENGPELLVDYVLQAVSRTLREKDHGRTISRTGRVNSNKQATISLPANLLPYTQYNLTAFPANKDGTNKDSSLTMSVVFTTKPTCKFFLQDVLFSA